MSAWPSGCPAGGWLLAQRAMHGLRAESPDATRGEVIAACRLHFPELLASVDDATATMALRLTEIRFAITARPAAAALLFAAIAANEAGASPAAAVDAVMLEHALTASIRDEYLRLVAELARHVALLEVDPALRGLSQ